MILTVLAVAAFALANGVNDGGTIVATGVRARLAPPWLGVLLLVVVVGAAPAVLGSEVARTLAERLVGTEGGAGRAVVLAAVTACLAVVLLLAVRGLPTSLTLGLIGGVYRAGVAAGQPVDWRLIAVVLAIGAAAPVVGLLGALVLHRTTTRLLGARPRLRAATTYLAYLLQCLAYGVNDGQKMLAVAAVLAGTGAALPGVGWWLWATVVAVFAVGVVVGVARVGPTVDSRVLSPRPVPVTQAQLAGAVAVLGSAALASPVSLTQAVTGGLIGGGVAIDPGRVRWRAAAHLAGAWALTLPSAFVVGAVLVPLAEVIA